MRSVNVLCFPLATSRSLSAAMKQGENWRVLSWSYDRGRRGQMNSVRLIMELELDKEEARTWGNRGRWKQVGSMDGAFLEVGGLLELGTKSKWAGRKRSSGQRVEYLSMWRGDCSDGVPGMTVRTKFPWILINLQLFPGINLMSGYTLLLHSDSFCQHWAPCPFSLKFHLTHSQ